MIPKKKYIETTKKKSKNSHKRSSTARKSNYNDNSSSIWVIRHLHRMDRDEPDKWRKNPRMLQNFLDSPLTEFGKNAAMKAGLEIVDNTPNINLMHHIYCSPFTRCIETSIEIAKIIKKYTNKPCKIRIEYGLSETIPIQLDFIKVNDKELTIDKFPLLDYEMSIDRLYARYPNFIDMSYKSMYKKSDIVAETLTNSADRIVKVMHYLTSRFDNFIVCSHQIPVTLVNMYLYEKNFPPAYMYKINPPIKDNKTDMNPKRMTSYGILSGFVKINNRWKYIYPPNNDYYQ